MDPTGPELAGERRGEQHLALAWRAPVLHAKVPAVIGSSTGRSVTSA